MIGILASALVVAAVAAFLVWWAHYRVERITADTTVHTQLTAIRAALRDAGITVGEDQPKPKPHLNLDTDVPARPGRHAVGRNREERA